MAIRCRKEQGLWYAVALALLVHWVLGAVVSALPPEWRVRIGPDGGYEGVTVAIAEGLAVQDRGTLLDNLKALLRRTSELLFQASEGKIFFAEVTILVPRSWGIPKGDYFVGRLEGATIRIDAANHFHRHTPYVDAVRPCGKGEEYIHLTPEAVIGQKYKNESVGDIARALVHAWARYRWGIFEEYGHKGDETYPFFREMSSGHWDPTGCSPGYDGILRTPTGGNCSREESGRPEQDCLFIPDDQGMTQEACIMYQYNLKSKPRFCTDETHERLAPNKQNNLCGHRSSWSVMKEHEDFKGTSARRSQRRDTTFYIATYSGDAPLNVLVLLDISRGDARITLWKYLRTELKVLVDSLPFGSSVGVATYEGKGERYRFRKLAPLSPMTSDAQRSSLKATIDSIKGSKEVSRETARALENAARMVDKGQHGGGDVLLLFTQMGPGSDDVEEKAKIRLLQERRMRVMGLSFLDPQSAPGLLELSLRTGGRWVTARKVSVREDIREFMEFAASTKSVDTRLYHMSSGVLRLGMEDLSQATILVEESLGRLPSFDFMSADGVTTTLLTPNGTAIDVATDESCSLIRGQHHCEFDVAEPGNWTITYNSSSCSSQTTVGFEAYSYQRVESQLADSLQPRVRFWTSGDDSNGIVDLTKDDLLVYAHVHVGHAPVVDLHVTLTGETSRNSRSAYTTDLADDGLDPDITAGDGVYTGIIFPDTSGTLLMTLSVRGTGKTSHLQEDDGMLPGRALYRGASGSNADEEEASPGREYVMQRTLVKFTTVKVTGVAGHKARPQRICDFRAMPRVEYVHDEAFVTLRWTSPKPRDGASKVQRYILYFSFNLSEILNVDHSGNASSLGARDVFPDGGFSPLTAGEEQTVMTRIQLKLNKTTAYFRIQSINSLETKSEPSRIVPVHLKISELNSTATHFNESSADGTSILPKDHASTAAVDRSIKPLFQPIAASSNSSTGNNATHHSPGTPVTSQPWFIAVVALASVLVAAAFSAGVALYLRSRSRKRNNSLSEAILGWHCFKGGVLKRTDPEEGKGAGDHRVLGQGVWRCMSRGYPSTGNLGLSVATVGRIEASRWIKNMDRKESKNVDNESVEQEDVVDSPDGPGPYKEVFIRSPNDVTTEL